MYTRTSILSASVGVLLLTVAPTPLGSDSEASPPARADSAADPASCAVDPETPAADLHSFKRLRAAYASAPADRDESVAPPVDVGAGTLWLARAVYSETKRPHEQELVAWVVRNRVDTDYRGNSTYREAVLDPYQFSAFNPGSAKRSLLMSLGPDTPLPRWQQALWVAQYVRHADPVYRPFSVETRHFYSERSMDGRRAPYWAENSGVVSPAAQQYTVDEERFRFFERIL
jgi:hypothetical protein